MKKPHRETVEFIAQNCKYGNVDQAKLLRPCILCDKANAKHLWYDVISNWQYPLCESCNNEANRIIKTEPPKGDNFEKTIKSLDAQIVRLRRKSDELDARVSQTKRELLTHLAGKIQRSLEDAPIGREITRLLKELEMERHGITEQDIAETMPPKPSQET